MPIYCAIIIVHESLILHNANDDQHNIFVHFYESNMWGCCGTFGGLGASRWYLLVPSFWMGCSVFNRGDWVPVYSALVVLAVTTRGKLLCYYNNLSQPSHALLFVLLPVLIFEYIYDVTTAINIFLLDFTWNIISQYSCDGYRWVYCTFCWFMDVYNLMWMYHYHYWYAKIFNSIMKIRDLYIDLYTWFVTIHPPQ